MTTNGSIVLKLIRLQRKLKITDQEFADKLKISRSSWTLTRLGKQSVGIAILSGICQAFPDMDNDVISFLKGNNRNEH